MKLHRPLREGYLLIDHRSSPGVPEFGIKSGSLKEYKTLTCGHCQSLVVLNPDRVRDRAWCYYCNEYICDTCAAQSTCSTINKRIDDAAEMIIQGGVING